MRRFSVSPLFALHTSNVFVGLGPSGALGAMVKGFSFLVGNPWGSRSLMGRIIGRFRVTMKGGGVTPFGNRASSLKTESEGVAVTTLLFY